MDQVINLNLEEGEFHEEAIASLLEANFYDPSYVEALETNVELVRQNSRHQNLSTQT